MDPIDPIDEQNMAMKRLFDENAAIRGRKSCQVKM